MNKLMLVGFICSMIYICGCLESEVKSIYVSSKTIEKTVNKNLYVLVKKNELDALNLSESEVKNVVTKYFELHGILLGRAVCDVFMDDKPEIKGRETNFYKLIEDNRYMSLFKSGVIIKTVSKMEDQVIETNFYKINEEFKLVPVEKIAPLKNTGKDKPEDK